MIWTGLFIETKLARGNCSGEQLLSESRTIQEGGRLRTYLYANLARVSNRNCEWNIATKGSDGSHPTSNKRRQEKLDGVGSFCRSNRPRALFVIDGQKSGEYFVHDG